MSEEKAFRDLLYDVVKEADPVLYEAIGDALSPYLDVELVINLVASYTITMRRTYLSCAMKPSTSNTTETTEKYADAHIGGSILCRRLCVLVDDLVETEVKQVYLKVVHNDVKPLRCKVEPKLVGYSTKKCKLWLTRPDVRYVVFFFTVSRLQSLFTVYRTSLSIHAHRVDSRFILYFEQHILHTVLPPRFALGFHLYFLFFLFFFVAVVPEHEVL